MPVIPNLKAHEFCKLVLQNEINRLGVKAAFTVNGILLVYSGPTQKIQQFFNHRLATNWLRAKDEMAARLGATIIDNTPIGQFLTKLKLKKYFKGAYGKNRKAIKNAELEVWSYASRALCRAAFKEVYTVVCGADPKNVFRLVEQEEIVKYPLTEIINKRPRSSTTRINVNPTPTLAAA